MKSAKSRSLGTAHGEMSAEAQDGPEDALVGAKVHSELPTASARSHSLSHRADSVCLGCQRLSDLTTHRYSEHLSSRSHASQDTQDNGPCLKSILSSLCLSDRIEDTCLLCWFCFFFGGGVSLCCLGFPQTPKLKRSSCLSSSSANTTGTGQVAPVS